jgi:ketosteroid isomerase-like protein
MPHPNEDVVRSFYEARAKGDRDAIRRLLDSNVEWHDPYPPPFGGDFAGIDEVMDFLFGPLVQGLEDSGLRLHDVVANDRHTVALVEWWAVLNGRRMDGREIGVYHLQGDRIAEVWFTTEDKQASDAFFGGPPQS